MIFIEPSRNSLLWPLPERDNSVMYNNDNNDDDDDDDDDDIAVNVGALGLIKKGMTRI